MPSSTISLDGEQDDPSRPDTPLASSHIAPPAIVTPDANIVASRLIQPPANDSNSGHLLIPIPNPSGNKSQASFLFSGVVDDGTTFNPLSPEIASANFSIAPDGSFVETSSGPAARELKRRYDQHLGVGMSVRSPFAITAFINQHGKQMYRVGHRESSAPATSGAEAEQRLSSQSLSKPPDLSPPQLRRRSRMSMHALLQPAMFKNGGSSSRPQTTTTGPRKLRKTRSIPDMSGTSLGAESMSGRIHSHSVTAADMPRYNSSDSHRSIGSSDIFGDVMDWSSIMSSGSTSFSTHSLFLPGESSSYAHGSSSRAIIAHPFGPGVSFDAPSQRPTNEHLPPPRLLREMQSFESGLTARQHDTDSIFTTPVPKSTSTDLDHDRPPSVVRIRDASSSIPGFSPAPETSMHSRFSTDVFDVLQTYRGLPLLDKLSPESEQTTVIKLSLATDGTAAPRDDPRFIIWGEIQSERDLDELSISQGSLTDLSPSVTSSVSHRKSTKGRNGKAPADLPSLRLSPMEGPRKVLIAATIERWIAQLTSDLDYDELLNFFLTYRTYISSVDLCHLLICRFHWALAQHTSAHDERIRRIVRVRTFVAIRYWVLTFFTVDFMPNRELRLLIADWLNTLIRDPILKKHSDGLSIVKKLIKVIKDCKRAHIRSSTKPKPRRFPAAKPLPSDHVLGEKFAQATQKLDPEDEDSDVDLDFRPDEGVTSDPSSGFQNDPVNAHLNVVHVGAGLSPSRPVSLPLSSISILQQSNRTLRPDADIPLVQTPTTLPVHHNALSRAFVNTIGRLGRWKRVLNSRTISRTPLAVCADVSAFDLDLGASRDLLTVNGGVEQYLDMIETKEPLYASNPGPSANDQEVVASTSSAPPVLPDELPPSYAPDSAATEPLSTSVDETSELGAAVADGQPIEVLAHRMDSIYSLSSLASSPRAPAHILPPHGQQAQFDVVSIDELDLSDNSSDENDHGPSAPPGLRRLPRRLPLRRDFEFIRRSESVSSMGITSRDSMASEQSSMSEASVASVGGLGGNIHQWQMNALVDSLSNDEETGDVEAALRRLEGQINPQKQQEKASKVDGWVKTIQERMAAGDYEDDQPRFLSDDEDEGDPGEQSPDEGGEDGDDSVSFTEGASISPPALSVPHIVPVDAAPDDTMTSTHITSHNTSKPPSGPGSPIAVPDIQPVLEDVIPLEILRSRVPSRPSTSHSNHLSISSKFVNPDKTPKIHRSFILNYRAETLVEHFSLIDRELFMGVKFEELVLDDWEACEEVNVLDWAQFLKDRARWKAESRWAHKTSALAAVRARFNLIANFTMSEIVLTQPNERAMVVGKFIRIAWKAYCLRNFNTLVAVIAGLNSNWVAQAMRKTSWSKVGAWEMRMFKDLKVYTSNQDGFKHIREAIDTIVDAKPMMDVASPSVVSGSGTDGPSSSVSGSRNRGVGITEAKSSTPTACVPFIGVYLSQLHRYNRLPDLIDPTAPDEAVGIDAVTGNFDAPGHPEVFSALEELPASMQLEPLINVHKQRLIAEVIKALVAGQHLASRVAFGSGVDRKLFQRCVRLRGLDPDTLQRALNMY